MPFSRAVYANRLSRSGPYRRGAYSGSYVPAFSPLQLSGLRAWYDAELGQPKNVGYVYLDGTSGDYIYTPDSAALDALDGDIEVVMRVWCANWATGSTQTLTGRYVSSGNQRCFRFYTSGAGAIGLSGSPDGTSGALITPSVTPTSPLPTSQWFWLRMRLDLSDGSNSVATIDTAADTGSNYLEPVSWTANGSGVAAVISGIHTGTAPLEIGSFSNGTLERFTGRVGRVIARDGFDGTTVSDFNASDCYGDGYWHSGGYRWTLGLPKIYDTSGNNHPPATFGSGSNQPQWLPWTGRAQVYFPGVANNHLSAGNLDHTGDYTARVHLNVRTIGTQLAELVSDRATSVGEATLRMDGGTGTLTTLNFLWWESGVPKFASSAAHGIIDGQDAWLGVERINNNGGVYRIRFYKSLAESPSMNDWTGWTLISEHVGPTVAAPSVSTSSTYIGGANVTYTGSIYRVVTTNNGVQTIDFVAASCGQSGYTDTLGNVWTVNRSTSGRKTVVQSPAARSARSVWLFGTDDVATILAAAMPPMLASSNFEVDVVARQWGTSVTNGRWFDCRAASPFPGAVMSVNSGTSFGATLTDGTNSASPTAVTLTYGQRAVAAMFASDAGQTFGVALNADTPSTTSAAAVGNRTGSDATIARTAPATSGYQDIEVEAVTLRSTAGTQTERGLLVAYYGGGL